MKEAGLLEEVVEDFQKELQQVLKGLEERVCEPPLQVKGQRETFTHTATQRVKQLSQFVSFTSSSPILTWRPLMAPNGFSLLISLELTIDSMPIMSL